MWLPCHFKSRHKVCLNIVKFPYHRFDGYLANFLCWAWPCAVTWHDTVTIFFLWHIRTWFLLKSALSCCALGCDSLAQRVQIKWNRLESLNIGHTGSKCLSFTYQSTRFRNRVDTFSASPIWIVWEICTLMFKKLLKIQKWSKMDALLMWQGKHTEVHEKNKDIILWPTVCM